LLFEDEVIRADLFHFARDRQNFTATRAFLRILLGSYTAIDPKEINFVYGEKSTPLAQSSPQYDSGAVQCLAFGRKSTARFWPEIAIGVDVEQIQTNFDTEGLARRFFSPTELQALASVPHFQKTDVLPNSAFRSGLWRTAVRWREVFRDKIDHHRPGPLRDHVQWQSRDARAKGRRWPVR
jgi:phosphopantetheinyl transferase